MSFELTVPQSAHDDLSNLIATRKGMKHITAHTATHPGVVKDPSGLVLHYEPITGTDRIRVEIMKNPENVAEDIVQKKLERDLSLLMGE